VWRLKRGRFSAVPAPNGVRPGLQSVTARDSRAGMYEEKIL
jgi:hypothetical protein